jgi:serine/threonine-protein kinase RIM15
MSPEAKDLIMKLLNPNPKERLGIEGVKAHPFFKSIDWATIHEQKMPFVPRPQNIMDTSYFDSEWELFYS